MKPGPLSKVQCPKSLSPPGLWTLDIELWTLDTVDFANMSEGTEGSMNSTGVNSDLLDPYERLINIEILGQRVEVPEKNRLLRCFQFLSLNSISYGDFCWNGDCTNCQVWYHTEGQARESDKPGLACRMEVIEEMVITSMTPFIKLDGITK